MTRKVILSLLYPSLIGLLISKVLNQFHPFNSEQWFAALLFFICIGVIFNVTYALSARSKDFTQILLIAIVLKLLLALSYIVYFSFGEKPAFFAFAMHFLLHFIAFTVFEIRFVLSIIRLHSRS
jgi:hypothetical protein